MRWLLPHPHNPLGIASEGPQESLKVSQNTGLFPVTIYHGLLLLSKEKLLTVFTLRVTEKNQCCLSMDLITTGSLVEQKVKDFTVAWQGSPLCYEGWNECLERCQYPFMALTCLCAEWQQFQ